MKILACIFILSVLVTDSKGFHPRAISKDGAEAIASVCEKTSMPLHCAALLVVLAFHESGYNPKAIHDGGKGCGAFGVLCTRPHASWQEQAREAWTIVLDSTQKCVEPLALYASGSCTNRGGITISRARMAEARKIAASGSCDSYTNP